MKTIFNDHFCEIEINKSRFIGYVFHIENIDDFKNKLKEIEKLYPKATHYCYAYSIGQIKKSNDNGEPSGTAGLPILNTIISNEIDNVGLVVIRYFGGIKLGAGGLTRAYRQIANDTIKTSLIKTITPTQKYKLIYDYNLNNVIMKFISSNNIYEIDTLYEINIVKYIATNQDISKLIDLTNGKIEIIKEDLINLIN